MSAAAGVKEAKPLEGEVTAGLLGNGESCQCCRHSHHSSGRPRDTPSGGRPSESHYGAGVRFEGEDPRHTLSVPRKTGVLLNKALRLHAHPVSISVHCDTSQRAGVWEYDGSHTHRRANGKQLTVGHGPWETATTTVSRICLVRLREVR